MRKVFHGLIIVAALTLGFWLYGGVRTMRETVNFQLTNFLVGNIFTLVLPLAIIVPIYIAKRMLFDNKILPISTVLFAFAGSLFVGGVISEALILRDEHKFFVEVAKANAPYHRARAWPNEGCSLVYIPGKGVHATD